MRSKFALLALSLYAIAACAHKTEATDQPAVQAPLVSKTTTDLAKPTAPTKVDAYKTDCTHDKETRTLEVTEKDKGCELNYNKDAKNSVVATSHKGKKPCQQALTKIQEKLTAAGYTCK